MPPALWVSGADALLVSKLVNGRWRRALTLATLAILHLVLIGPFTVVHQGIVAVKYNSNGDRMIRQVGGPWLQTTRYDVWGEHQYREWRDTSHPHYGFEAKAPFALCWLHLSYRDFTWHNNYRWAYWYTLPTVEFVVAPVVTWLAVNALLHVLTWRPRSVAGATLIPSSSRRAALLALRRATLAPVRVAWVTAMGLLVVLISAPVVTTSFRAGVWWLFMAVGCGFPALISARALITDRAAVVVRLPHLAAVVLLLVATFIAVTCVYALEWLGMKLLIPLLG